MEFSNKKFTWFSYLVFAKEVHLEVAVEVGPLVAENPSDDVHAVLRAAGRLRGAPVEVADQLA